MLVSRESKQTESGMRSDSWQGSLARTQGGSGEAQGSGSPCWIDPPRARTLGIDCVTYSFRGAVNVTVKLSKSIWVAFAIVSRDVET